MKSGTKFFVIYCVTTTALLVFIYHLDDMSQWKLSPDIQRAINLGNKQQENNSKLHTRKTSGTKRLQKIDSRTQINEPPGNKHLQEIDSRTETNEMSGTKYPQKTDSRTHINEAPGNKHLQEIDSRTQTNERSGTKHPQRTASRTHTSEKSGTKNSQQIDSTHTNETSRTKHPQKIDSRTHANETSENKHPEHPQKIDSRTNTNETYGTKHPQKIDSSTRTKETFGTKHPQKIDSRTHTNESSGTKHPQKTISRRNLIILSPGRGGSSFLGGIFDSSPQNMYWFEPLWLWREELLKLNVLKTRKGIIQYKENSVNLINSLLKCDFSDIPSALLSRFTDKFFYARSTAFTTLCSHRRCRPFSSTLLNQVCNSYKHTVIKILDHRLPNGTIQSFQELFQRQHNYEVKVIQLVRDPRAVVYSRVYSAKWIKWNYRDPNFPLYVHEICDRLKQNIRMGLLNPLPWLKDRFKLIRLEDLVLNTANVSHDLYKFAGFDWSVSVDEFISSHNRSPDNLKEGAYTYSLYRKASDVIDKWKNAPKEFIRVIEDVCGDLMHILGYEKLLKPH